MVVQDRSLVLLTGEDCNRAVGENLSEVGLTISHGQSVRGRSYRS